MDQDDQIERLVRKLFGTGYEVTGGPVWLTVTPGGFDLPEDGWKLHVSSRALTFPALADQLLPVLRTEGCAFKVARSVRALDELNDGITSPSNVGKAVTIYPDQARVRELGLKLAGLLGGHQGPRVLSDRRVQGSAPVYYRFGPFTTKRAPDARGRLVTTVHGPDGEEVEAAATLRYYQPTWTIDPFTGESGDAGAAPDPIVLGGHYQVLAGIREAAQGNVFRARDRRHGTTVVIKQARALVAEHSEHNDARLRLRNERRVLGALDGVAGVPRFIDHFKYGGDEFLVTSDCGEETLEDKVRKDGPFQPDDLAAKLASILRAVHSRGVVMRDLSPKNVLVDGVNVTVIDFALACYTGLHLPGGTPGYAPARQFRDETPRDTDDLHALGLTLLFAATGLHPVDPAGDQDRPRVRALQTINAVYGPEPTGLFAAIADLLSDDDEIVRAAFESIAAGSCQLRKRPAKKLPAAPVVTPELAADLADSLLRDLTAHVREILRAPVSSLAANDFSVYSGTAGIGLELLAHAKAEPAENCLPDLVSFTARAARRGTLAPGLYAGVTGVHVFLHEARTHGLDVGSLGTGNSIPVPDWVPEGDDLIVGAAGVGLGHLYLYQVTDDPAHLAVASRCARPLMTGSEPASALTSSKRPNVGVDPTLGRAHGLAGVTALLLALAGQTGDADALAAAAHRTGDVAGQARSLLDEASRANAARMSASWCQGFAGIGETLLPGSAVLSDPGLLELARAAAGVCLARVPRMETLGQCCGAAGVGNFLLNLAAFDDDERYRAGAHEVAAHIVRRNAGTIARPDFGAGTAPEYIDSWAAGLAGLLSFFRRIAWPGSPESLPMPALR